VKVVNGKKNNTEGGKNTREKILKWNKVERTEKKAMREGKNEVKEAKTKKRWRRKKKKESPLGREV